MQYPSEYADTLRAIAVLAAADGRISSSERGLLMTIASRFGVSSQSVDRLIQQAKEQPSIHDRLFQFAHANPEMTLELLVAAARLDGEIADPERELLGHFAERLEIPVEQFEEIFLRGVKRADALRQAKFGD